MGYAVAVRRLLACHESISRVIYLRCTNGKSSVQHSRTKDEAVTAPTCLVRPLLPYKLAARVSFACLTWHDCAYHDGDEDAHEDEEEANVGQFREGAICEHDNGAGKPSHDEIYDEDVPALIGIAWVE